jgi:hypothetical protein
MTSQQKQMTETEKCVSCERETDDLSDDGECEPCQFERDIRKAEVMLDAARDR